MTVNGNTPKFNASVLIKLLDGKDNVVSYLFILFTFAKTAVSPIALIDRDFKF